MGKKPRTNGKYKNKIKREKCELCNYDRNKTALEIHHKDFDCENNTIENLQVLCANCHREITYPNHKPKRMLCVICNKESYSTKDGHWLCNQCKSNYEKWVNNKLKIKYVRGSKKYLSEDMMREWHKMISPNEERHKYIKEFIVYQKSCERCRKKLATMQRHTTNLCGKCWLHFEFWILDYLEKTYPNWFKDKGENHHLAIGTWSACIESVDVKGKSKEIFERVLKEYVKYNETEKAIRTK